MKFNRRDFFLTLGNLFPLIVLASNLSVRRRKYRASYKFLFGSLSDKAQFESFRGKWEKRSEIELINQVFSSQGALIDLTAVDRPNSLEIIYTFSGRKEFEDWAEIVKGRNLFDVTKAPQNVLIERTFFYV